MAGEVVLTAWVAKGDDEVHVVYYNTRGLVAGEEVAGVDFLFDVLEVVGDAIGDNDGAGFFEAGKIAGDGATVKLGLVQRRFVNKNAFAFGFNELDDVLDGRSAEVVGVGFHRETINADDVGVLF